MGMGKHELTNKNIRKYKEEYNRLIADRERLNTQIDAVLTVASIELDKVYNNHRLDFAHINNAYAAFLQNDLTSMQFKLVDNTIRELFLNNDDDFKFISIIPYESIAYEFIYQYGNKTISIKISVASTITKDNIDLLDWGIFTVCDMIKRTTIGTEKVVIVRSDDVTVIKNAIIEYLNIDRFDDTQSDLIDE